MTKADKENRNLRLLEVTASQLRSRLSHICTQGRCFVIVVVVFHWWSHCIVYLLILYCPSQFWSWSLFFLFFFLFSPDVGFKERKTAHSMCTLKTPPKVKTFIIIPLHGRLQNFAHDDGEDNTKDFQLYITLQGSENWSPTWRKRKRNPRKNRPAEDTRRGSARSLLTERETKTVQLSPRATQTPSQANVRSERRAARARQVHAVCGRWSEL